MNLRADPQSRGRFSETEMRSRQRVPRALPLDVPTLVDALRERAQSSPDTVALSFLVDGETLEEPITYGDLDRRARAIATVLLSVAPVHSRVLLLFPPGIDYVVGFYAALYADMLAVPAYPPTPGQLERTMGRLRAIVSDSKPAAVLTIGAILPMLQAATEQFEEFASVHFVAIDEVPLAEAAAWVPSSGLRSESIAFLQYTSGSTGNPKGVQLTHGNLLANIGQISHMFDVRIGETGFSWLPPYHDMGLIGCILTPLVCGILSRLMSPIMFLQRPMRWIEALSRTRTTMTGAPNFAYELCVRKARLESLEDIDLGALRLAFSGAESVRRETIDRFVKLFGPVGFRQSSFLPCYGLAEATLLATGSPHSTPPRAERFDSHVLETRGEALVATDGAQANVLTSVGAAPPGTTIAIVDPVALRPVPDGRLGEIWVAGPSVGTGYWKRPDESESVFGVTIPERTERFLRTGDLGFVHQGDLFVASRLKDLIVIGGRNHYPQDVELVVEGAHAALRPGCGAAFSVDMGGEEQLVVVHEFDRRIREDRRGAPGASSHPDRRATSDRRADNADVEAFGPPKSAAPPADDLDHILSDIRTSIQRHTGLVPGAIVLIRAGSVPKTSSGKIQRRACRDAFVDGTLQELARWTDERHTKRTGAVSRAKAPSPVSAPAVETPRGDAARVLQERLRALMAKHLHVDAGRVDVRASFDSMGVRSVDAVGFSGEIERWLGRRVSPTVFYEHPSIEALAEHLVGARRATAAPLDEGVAPAGQEESIAIVGIACRFPGANGPDEYWNLLRNGVDAIREVPASRWDAAALYDPDTRRPGKTNARWGGFLDDVDRFDPWFFGISPREALRMDPQQRLLLETAWEALIDAGIATDSLAGTKTGVFVGISQSDYRNIQSDAFNETYVATGSALSVAANRISYQFDFRGPSLAVDTACSSSLVSVHLACEAIRSGEATLALAGGVNLILSPEVTIQFTKMGFMAPDGRCKAFDARADGYVRSEGVGLVVLKPLSRALADGDFVYAVVRGSAVNQDGRTNGLTAPGRDAQEAVIRAAHRRAGIPPSRVQYVETHGTGTSLGDPIEAAALGSVLFDGRPRTVSCAIGSVKTNIGHLESAAGIAGLIKTALALRHGQIPPSLHFEKPNPLIQFETLGLRVQTALGSWREDVEGALAGVSSFGFGGTNAHVILQAAPARASIEPFDTEATLVPFSAESPDALRELLHDVAATLDTASDAESVTGLATSAALRRSHFDHRVAFIAKTRGELRESIARHLAGDAHPGVVEGRRDPTRSPRVAFVFAGQGSQWWPMGRQLAAREPAFRAALLACDEHFRPLSGWSLVERLTRSDEASARLDATEIAQPALVALQIALAALWREYGLEPGAVIGHSVGEISAAHVAGALDLANAMKLVFHRSRLMQRATGAGRMVSVESAPEALTPFIAPHSGRVAIAAMNAPGSVVLSGDSEPIREIVDALTARGIHTKMLPVDYAFHSPQMEAFVGELHSATVDLERRTLRVPLYSSVTGERSENVALASDYWTRNMREPVQFHNAVRALLADGFDTIVEVGPHPVLASSIVRTARESDRVVSVVPSLRRNEPERSVMLTSLASLHVRAVPLTLRAAYPRPAAHVKWPRPRWHRERFWPEVGHAASDAPRRAQSKAGRLGPRTVLAYPAGSHLWEFELDRESASPFAGHRVHDTAVLPGTAYVDLALSAARDVGLTEPSLEDVEFHRPMPLPSDTPIAVQVVLTENGANNFAFRVFSRHASPDAAKAVWTLHATGRISNPPASTGR